MPVAQHWTANKTDAFVYRIASDFIVQLEKKMDGQVNQSDLAKRLGVSKGRVSQVFNNPGNLTLKKDGGIFQRVRRESLGCGLR